MKKKEKKEVKINQDVELSVDAIIPEVDFFDATKDLFGEKWMKVENVEKHYEISNYGRLKSFAVCKEGSISKNKDTSGYLASTLRVDGKKKNLFIHKLVAKYFLENTDNSKTIVIHLDNNKKNNHYKNLKWVDQRECFVHNEKFNPNLKKFRHNVSNVAKITMEIAQEIRRMIKVGILQSEIAKMYNISEMQVTRIKRNENWVSK